MDFSVHFYFQNGHVMTSGANQLQGVSLASENKNYYTLESKSDIVNGKHSKYVHCLENLKCYSD